jgi:hydrogenase maturation protease
MSDDRRHPRALVVSCGNRFRGDDALGPFVAELLSSTPMTGLGVVDLGRRIDLLIDLLDDVELLIVVDALSSPSLAPGTIVEIDWPTLREMDGPFSSTHGLRLIEQLHFAHRLGILPPVVRVIGVTVVQTEYEQPLSPLIRRRAGEVARRVVELVQLQFAKVRTS